MVPIHPGRILRRELKARGLSANALARALRVSSGRIVDILNAKRSISAETWTASVPPSARAQSRTSSLAQRTMSAPPGRRTRTSHCWKPCWKPC